MVQKSSVKKDALLPWSPRGRVGGRAVVSLCLLLSRLLRCFSYLEGRRGEEELHKDAGVTHHSCHRQMTSWTHFAAFFCLATTELPELQFLNPLHSQFKWGLFFFFFVLLTKRTINSINLLLVTTHHTSRKSKC